MYWKCSLKSTHFSCSMQIRTPSLYIPKSVYSGETTVAQDIEPEQVTISSDGRTAYVTLRVSRLCIAPDFKFIE